MTPELEAARKARLIEMNIHVPLEDYIGKIIASSFGRQPCMSGDQRDRLLSHERRAVDDATATIVHLIDGLTLPTKDA